MHIYAAHLVTYIECTDGSQKDYPIMEDVVLILATSPEQAWEKAEALGRERADASPLEWGGRPARTVFAGIKRLMEADDLAPQSKKMDGVEVTFSAFTAPDLETVLKFATNEPVSVIYQPRMGMDAP